MRMAMWSHWVRYWVRNAGFGEVHCRRAGPKELHICSDFMRLDSNPGNTMGGLVMKGPPVRVRPSA
jgi:hypothetical protein